MTYFAGMKNFGPEALYNWRIENNLTQAQAAEVLGVAKGTLKNWEQGIRRIPTTIELLIEKLKPSDLPADRGPAGTRPIGVRAHNKQK
jgi:transcriptional regulator with XRE-family HTH domain